MGASGFCLNGSGFLGDKIFRLVFNVFFCGWIGDLCELCFIGGFLFLGVVCVWVVDFVYGLFLLFHWVSLFFVTVLIEFVLLLDEFQLLLKL